MVPFNNLRRGQLTSWWHSLQSWQRYALGFGMAHTAIYVPLAVVILLFGYSVQAMVASSLIRLLEMPVLWWLFWIMESFKMEIYITGNWAIDLYVLGTAGYALLGIVFSRFFRKKREGTDEQ